MFYCVKCSKRYTMQDVEDGYFFPSTSVCLECYQKLAKTSSSCFADKSKYSLKELACSSCVDNKICRTFIHHRKEFKEDR